MKVFKFGGASVKDADGIKNVIEVVKKTHFTEGVMVISAMGKMTNALENLVYNYLNNGNYEENIGEIKDFHWQIMNDLFPKDHKVYNEVESFFAGLESFIKFNKSTNYNFIYDQIVSLGELISTTIVSNYFELQGIKNTWLDGRNLIKTDSNYREGTINWSATEQNLQTVDSQTLSIIQGFIASDPNNFSVTLGREGSDYTAAIVSYCLNAESMTIWKDVEGVLNADPRYFDQTTLLDKISYSEAVEMAFYGATIIHPKTLKPLENKNIPFYVKSFINPTHKGTEITLGAPIEPHIPCYILKQNQILVEVSPKDFSFISEEHISSIFKYLSQSQLKTTLMQISAISLSLCLEDKFMKIDDFLENLAQNFKVQTTKDVSLYTIRHFDEKSKEETIKGKEIILEQIIKETLQIVTTA